MEAGGTNRLMRLLRALRFCRVLAAALNDHLVPEAHTNHLCRFADRLLTQRGRVRAHVRDQTCALTANVYTFVKLLRELHGDA